MRARALAWSALIAIFLAHAWYLAVVVEDAFITFRFAKHLAEGRGLVWNTGEAAVEGYTSFLWLISSASVQAVGLSAEFSAQILGMAAAIAAIVLVYRFGREVLGWSEGHAWLVAGLLSLSGPFAMWSASGMETTSFAALALGGVYGFARWLRTRGQRSFSRMAFASVCLASLTRPEGLVLAALLCGLGALAGLSMSRRALRDFMVDSCVFVIPFGAYFAWRYELYGFLFPMTYYAKTGGGLLQCVRGLRYLGSFGALFVAPFAPVLALAAHLGLREARHRRSVARRAEPSMAWSALLAQRLPEREAALALLGVVVLVYSACVASVGGDYMPMFRFVVPILPLLYLLLGHALGAAWAAAANSVRWQGLIGTGCAIGIVGTLIQSTPLESHLFPRSDMMEGTYRGVQLQRWYVNRYRAVASALRGHADPAQQSLGLFSIGVIGYDCDMPVYSPFGLVDPVIALTGGSIRPLGAGYPGHEKLDLVRWLEHRPTYLVFGYALSAALPQKAPRLPGPIARLVARDYRATSLWVDDAGNREAGYLTLFERGPARE